MVDWRSYTAPDGTIHFQAVSAPTSADELIKQRGFHPAQLIHSADGTEHYLLTEIIKEAWQCADFEARSELTPSPVDSGEAAAKDGA